MGGKQGYYNYYGYMRKDRFGMSTPEEGDRSMAGKQETPPEEEGYEEEEHKIYEVESEEPEEGEAEEYTPKYEETPLELSEEGVIYSEAVYEETIVALSPAISDESHTLSDEKEYVFNVESEDAPEGMLGGKPDRKKRVGCRQEAIPGKTEETEGASEGEDSPNEVAGGAAYDSVEVVEEIYDGGVYTTPVYNLGDEGQEEESTAGRETPSPEEEQDKTEQYKTHEYEDSYDMTQDYVEGQYLDDEIADIPEERLEKANRSILLEIDMKELKRGVLKMEVVFLLFLPILLIPVIGLLYFMFVPYIAGYIGGKRVPKRFCLVAGFIAGFLWSFLVLTILFLVVTYIVRVNVVLVEPAGLSVIFVILLLNTIICAIGSWHGAYYIKEHTPEQHEEQIQRFIEQRAGWR